MFFEKKGVVMLKKFKIGKILVAYGAIAVAGMVLIAGCFTFGLNSVKGGLEKVNAIGVEDTNYLKEALLNGLWVADDYMSAFLGGGDFDNVQQIVDEINELNAESDEIIAEMSERAVYTDELAALYDEINTDLVIYDDLCAKMNERLSAGDQRGARVYYLDYAKVKNHLLNRLEVSCDTFEVYSTEAMNAALATYRLTLIINIAVFIIALVLLVIASRGITNYIRKTMKEAVNIANELSEGNVEMTVDAQEELTSENEFEVLKHSFLKLIKSSQNQAKQIEAIASGDFSAAPTVRSNQDAVNISLLKMLDTMKELKAELLELTKQYENGNTNYHIDADKFEGGFKEIMDGINEVMDVYGGQVTDLLRGVALVGEGQLPEVDTNRPGNYGEAFKRLESTIVSIRNLIADTEMLADAAREGNYEIRADEDKYKGEYRNVIAGVNGTLDLIIDKIQWYVNVIDSIPLYVQVMDTKGNWVLLNKPFALNLQQKGIVKEHRTELYGKPCSVPGIDINGIHALTNGESETQFTDGENIFKQKTSDFIGKNGEKIGYIGVIQDLTAVLNQAEYSEAAAGRLERNLEALAAGRFDFEENNIPRKAHTEEIAGTFDTIDAAVEKVTTAIGTLVNDSVSLADSAVQGDLGRRADLAKYEGEYAKVMKGINDTIDAILTPISEVMAVLESVSAGDLKTTVNGEYAGDLEKSKNVMNITVHNLRNIIGDISRTLGAIANGDLTVETDLSNYPGDFTDIGRALQEIVAKLRDVMQSLTESSGQVASGSKQLSEAAQMLAVGSTKQAAAVQTLTTNIGEIASQTSKNAEDARKASELANGVKSSAERGDRQMKDMLASMNEINESSANISKIIKVIDDIAFQTNILALNAAVEAARAGVHGKGFAVVADEVRSLAAKSAEAASETTTLIEGSVNKVEAGTKIANATAEALSEIVEGIAEAASLVEGIADASNNQAKDISQVNEGIETVSNVIQSNSATSQQSAASSEELYGQADMLKRIVSEFRLNKNQAAGGAGMPLLPGIE